MLDGNLPARKHKKQRTSRSLTKIELQKYKCVSSHRKQLTKAGWTTKKHKRAKAQGRATSRFNRQVKNVLLGIEESDHANSSLRREGSGSTMLTQNDVQGRVCPSE